MSRRSRGDDFGLNLSANALPDDVMRCPLDGSTRHSAPLSMLKQISLRNLHEYDCAEKPASPFSRPALVTSVLACLLLTGCQSGILDPKGPIGAAEKSILIDSLVIMLAIVLPTIVAIVAFAWWFRASNGRARYLPNWEYSGQIEMVVWGIPLLVILLLGGVAWIGAHDLDPYKPLDSSAKPLNIQVVSLDWKWLFIYPDQKIASLNQLVVPAGVPLHLSLTSASVMNAFFVPQLGSMIYTMNGMTTQLNLRADETGVFHGLSSHFSGDGFADMNFNVRVVNQRDFIDWTQKSNTGPALDAASYSDLAKQTIHVAPATFKLTDDDLFHAIVTQKLPPGPGPAPSISPHSGG
jgi:cytochrome o ubiquinol oxidase subunit 2